MSHCHLANSTGVAGIGEGAVSFVLVKGVALIRQVSYHEIRPTVIIEVGEIHTHAGIGTPVYINRDFGVETDIFKSAIPFIAIEELRHGIVGDKKIDMAIAIIVRNRHTKSFPWFAEAYLLCDLGECSIPIIMVDQRGN